MIKIETDRLILRPLRMEDAESVFEYASDTEITTYVTWDAHTTLDDSKAYIESAIADQQKSPLCPLAIVLKSDPEQVIGTVGISSTPNEHEAVLSYVIARKHWRKGMVYEAASALVKLAFAEYGHKRIYAWCIKENKASSSLMKKLGMKFEGCHRSKAFRHGQFWDMEYYAILEDEWRQQQMFVEEQDVSDFPIIFDPDPSAEDVNVLHAGLSDNAKKKKDLDPMESFAFYVKDKQGQILGGCHGDLFYGCLYLGSLWVAENMRGKGFGTKLMESAEKYARKKDCTMTTVNTMDWEALELYQGLGYKIDFAREGYKNDSTFYFLSKELV